MEDIHAVSGATDGAGDWDADGDGDEARPRPVEVVLEPAGSEPFAGRSLLDPRRARVRRLGSIGPAGAAGGEP
jgi:hypothetical protein